MEASQVEIFYRLKKSLIQYVKIITYVNAKKNKKAPELIFYRF